MNFLIHENQHNGQQCQIRHVQRKKVVIKVTQGSGSLFYNDGKLQGARLVLIDVEVDQPDEKKVFAGASKTAGSTCK